MAHLWVLTDIDVVLDHFDQDQREMAEENRRMGTSSPGLDDNDMSFDPGKDAAALVLPNMVAAARSVVLAAQIAAQIEDAQSSWRKTEAGEVMPPEFLYNFLSSKYLGSRIASVESVTEDLRRTGGPWYSKGVPIDSVFLQQCIYGYTKISIAHATDTGRVREHNEDSLGSITPGEIRELNEEGRRSPDWDPLNRIRNRQGEPINDDLPRAPLDALAVVADGMGGGPAGEVASRITVEKLLSNVRERLTEWTGYIALPTISANYGSLGLIPQHTGFPVGIEELASSRLDVHSFVVDANEEVLHEAQLDPLKRGMGTTCTAAAVMGDRLRIAHVGDSRAYLFRDGRLEQLTRDHSWVQDEVDAGRVPPDQAWGHPKSNIITRAIGFGTSIDVDTYQYDLSDGDQILLCSDGLSDMLRDEEIRTVLASAEDIQTACGALIEAANGAGGRDNITTMILKVEPPERWQRAAV